MLEVWRDHAVNGLSFSIKCGSCAQVLQTAGEHATPFEFMDYARGKGWVVPLAIENKPIKCPACAEK